jgi:hypothetical protein
MPSAADPIARERLLAAAVAVGKIPPGRVDHYRAQYDRDPKGTEQLIDALAAVLPPADAARVSAAIASTAKPEPEPGGYERRLYDDDDQRGTGRIFNAHDQ